MSTTLAIRFPLGRFHATPWDRAVNEGATEWPPSPWRILRALAATWYTRWPDLPAATFDALLDALADPPCYRTPNVLVGHTRHYLPDLGHRKGQQGHTDLTLDPFLSLAPAEQLLIRWDATLDAEQRQVLAKLAELLPYLGRSESACEARLLDEETEPDESWWRPGTGQMRLLGVTRPVTRKVLEVTTTEVRRLRRMVPPGTRWVSYVSGDTATSTMPQRVIETGDVTAIRFAVMARLPMKATHGMLLADRVHEKAGIALRQAGIPETRRQETMGTKGAATDHAHTHWIALPDSKERGATIRNLIIWCRNGLQTDEVRALLNLGELSGRRGNYEVQGFPAVKLLFQAAGPIELVAPELCGRARWWHSWTPYLPVRHRKRETLEEYLAADLAAELRYRDKPIAVVSRVEPHSGTTDRWASEFRRHRLQERSTRSRPGVGLRLEFADEVEGPLLLGQLSHFGYGIFVPDESAVGA